MLYADANRNCTTSKVAMSVAPSSALTRQDLLRGASTVLIAFFASRLLVFGMTFLSRTIVHGGDFWVDGGPFSVLASGEGKGQIDLARYGYPLADQHQLSLGFFPFYPWLVRAVAFLLRDYSVAAVVVSNLSLLGAGLLLNALINLERNRGTLNQPAVMFLMFSPMGIFFSSAYPESTFLMLGVGALLAARLDRWVLASVCGMCLAATRNVGILVLVPLVIEYFRSPRAGQTAVRRLLDPRLLLLMLVPLGACYYLWEGYITLGKPRHYWNARLVWAGVFVSPIQTFRLLAALPPINFWLSSAAIAVAVALCLLGHLLKLRVSYLAFAVVLTCVFLCTGTPEAIPRFLSVVFPFAIIFALLSERWNLSYEPLLVTSIMALTFCTILRATGYWLV